MGLRASGDGGTVKYGSDFAVSFAIIREFSVDFMDPPAEVACMADRRILFVAIAIGFAAGAAPSFVRADEAAAIEFFERKIRPVLVEHCYECHAESSDELQGDLRLDTREAIRAGGPSGSTVTPGKPAESLLLEAIRYESLEMPPQGKLPDSVIRDFERWIADGAVDPREGDVLATQEVDLQQGRQFWSFQPLDATVPRGAELDGSGTTIDRFIRARQLEQDLSSNPPASPEILVRRLYFDLVGMPPTPVQVRDFLADESPDTYSRLVERLLASSEFGQQWGRHWLDVVRYSDSSGGGRTRIFQHAWRYRDYVIKAFNEDRPYDRFVAEQLAGDLMPYQSDELRRQQLTATGFLALGPTNYELQDKELLRMEVVDEQLDTLGRAMLGMTIGCARCHDHKFDPIGIADYYAMAGIFRSTKTLMHANVSNPIMRDLPVNPEHQQHLDAHMQKVKALKSVIADLEAKLKDVDSQSSSAVAAESLPGIVVDNIAADVVGSWTPSSHTPRYVGAGYLHDQNQQKGDSQAAFIAQIPASGNYEIRVAYSAGTNRAARVPVVIHLSDRQETIFIDQTVAPPIDGLFRSLGQYELQQGETVKVVVQNRGTQGHVIVDAVQWLNLTEDGNAEDGNVEQPVSEVALQTQALEKQLEEHRGELKRLESDAPKPPDRVMSVQEEEDPEDAFICVRGNVHNRGDDVARGFLRVVDRDGDWKIEENESGRRELAEWICSDENPLASRVLANRVWHHLFGTGLVGTPDNFGFTGKRPTHPFLLDYLAVRLIDSGWSVKALVREVVHSETYRMSSEPNARAAEVDPDNRLFCRQNRRRLTAEQIRDAILVSSGRLDRRMGGPSVAAGTKSEFGYVYTGHRRGVYVPVFRSTLSDLFEVFDVADPNIVVGKRNVSTRATQALFMMNSPFIVEQASHLSEEALRAVSSDQERMNWLYRRVLGREATENELAETWRFLGELKESGASSADSWTLVSQALFACLDFRYIH